ncbi:hypothetical protein GCM10027020_24470 [Nocardioides salsibiostraticola]
MRTFRITRSNGSTWKFLVNGVNKYTLNWGVSGIRVEAGLESYDSGAKMTRYDLNYLKYTKGAGSWTNWTGQDTETVGTPQLCGGWKSASARKAAQNKPC